MLADFIAQVVLGTGSMVALAMLWRHADDFSDGNVGADDE